MWAVKAALILSVLAAHAVDAPLAEHNARSSGRDIALPKALIEEIEKGHREFLEKNKVSSETFKRQMMNVAVELTQDKPVALTEASRVVTPMGGGVIDFSDYVTPLLGSFKLKFVPTLLDGTAPGGLHVYYVSYAKTRVLDGEKFGSGCGKYMDITSYFFKSSVKGGFELYTADQRYLSVVGGTFVFASDDKDALSVAAVNFYDSRYPDALCE